jgi:hypothetical protein
LLKKTKYKELVMKLIDEVWPTIRLFALTTFLWVSTSYSTHAQPFVTGLQGSAGSTVGPDGYLYVTEGMTGTVQRINATTGETSLFVEGLPPWIIGVGGAVDIAFIGDTAYVLVTLVNLFGEPSGLVNGVYRIDGPSSYTIIADLGAYSIENPPDTPFDFPTGVQWSIEKYRGGLIVSDGHHNRVLNVTQEGIISELRAFENVVPTGLDVSGYEIYLAQTGPAPHLPEDGKVVSFGPRSDQVALEASGASLLLDVEFGRGRSLYALSQGEWNGAFPGSSAIENDGALWEINDDGSLRLIEANINLPNSMEIIENEAYVVTLTGDVWRFENISSAPFGKGKGKP